ncbi:hypothetical protein V6N12_057536 [Hibiscus sabdariffa]|uniref:Uncharacterized protein n=1 Tax=Hibiscus sabdariffa TaxID=183260 RepID=A0ABR2C5E7_9ROSI
MKGNTVSTYEEKGRGTDDKEANFTKITGHVEDESLWLLEVPTIQLQYSNRRKILTKKSVRDDVEDSSSASSTSMESRKRKSHKSDQNEEPSLGTKNPQDTPTAKVGILNAHSKSISDGGSLSEPAKNDEYGVNSDNERQNHQVAQENTQLTNQRVSWAEVDRALSKLERKKRDRENRRSKQAGNSSPPVEVEGRSLSDSDLNLRRDILIREAKKTLQVGKSIGIQFRGDENEAVEELANIAEKEQHLL